MKNGVLLSLELDDSEDWASFRAVVSAKTGINGDYLDLQKAHVQACIEKFSGDMENPRVAEDEVNQLPIDETASDSGATFNATTSDDTVNDLVPSYRSSVDYMGFPIKWLREAASPVQVVPPAAPKGKYDPWEIPCFTSIGSKSLKPVEVGFDFDMQEPPCIWLYCKEEEWL